MAKKKTKKSSHKRKSSAKPAEKSPKDIIYVGVSDPIELRRNVLESSKDMIQIMQQFERFKEVRKEKMESMVILRNDLEEIKMAFNKLRKVLPHVKVRKHKVNPVTPVEETEVEQIPIKKLPKETRTELEKLEGELDNIERKLEHLS